jgi:hypothetical protein
MVRIVSGLVSHLLVELCAHSTMVTIVSALVTLWSMFVESIDNDDGNKEDELGPDSDDENVVKTEAMMNGSVSLQGHKEALKDELDTHDPCDYENAPVGDMDCIDSFESVKSVAPPAWFRWLTASHEKLGLVPSMHYQPSAKAKMMIVQVQCGKRMSDKFKNKNYDHEWQYR